jgi:LysR family transcriptional regulator, glycine cleavage system transcriptional activator
MRRRTPALSALRAFEAAARHRSFKLAADELSVTPTAISHRIRALESELRASLFVRKTRAVELTPDGKTLYAAVREGFDAITAGIERIGQRSRRSVTLSTTPAFATKWLVPRLASFQSNYPDIDLNVHASTQPVDLHAGDVDLAIRYGLGRYPGLTSTLLLADRYAPVASPTLNARQAKDIRSRRLIHFDWQQPLPVDLTWSAWFRLAGLKPPRANAGIRYSEESHAIQAAVAGQGVALLSLILVDQELKLGLLEAHVEPHLDGLSYYIVRPPTVAGSSAVATVEAWLVAAASPAFR